MSDAAHFDAPDLEAPKPPQPGGQGKDYGRLRSALVLKTLKRLQKRIQERFPDRNLHHVCARLVTVAEADMVRIKKLSGFRLLAPLLQTLSAVLVVAGLVFLGVMLWPSLTQLDAMGEGYRLAVMQGIDAFVAVLAVGVGAAYLLATLDSRRVRAGVLKDLHELRSMAHIIDMHQLTKDPVKILNAEAEAAQNAGQSAGQSRWGALAYSPTASSPERRMSAFELTRYLDYCTEMLALIGKIAALYAEDVREPVIIQTVNDVEQLTSTLSQKIYQKIMIIHNDADIATN